MLSFANIDDRDQDEINIGIIRPLESPFNLFLNFQQLINPDKRYIYYFVHSLGRRRIVLWGVYDKYQKEFIIEGGCRFNPNQLLGMTNKWKENGYKYTANNVHDRITPTIKKELNEPMWTHEEYTDNKRFYRYLTGELSYEKISEMYGNNFFINFLPLNVDYTDEFELQEFTLKLQHEIQEYEKLINRIDFNDDLMKLITSPIKSLLLELTSRFDKQIQDDKISELSYEQMLKDCPDLKVCKTSKDSLCRVYTFGTDGNLSELDPDQYL